MSKYLLLALILCAPPLIAKEKGNFPEISKDGLHLETGSNFEVVYKDPESDLSLYRKIFLLDAYVAFEKNWVRNMGSRNASTRLHVTERDLNEIKTTLAREFRTVFQNELQCRGYTLSDQVGEDVVIIRPAIIDLNINAPDLLSARPVQSHSKSAGKMTLYLELVDSTTSKLVSRIVDRKADSERNGMTSVTNSATNRAAASRILKTWAVNLSGMLNQQESKNIGPPGPCS